MKLTAEQKQDILDAYNAEKKNADFALDEMDYYTHRQIIATDEKQFRRAKRRESVYDAKHSFSMGVMGGIDRTLELLGLILVIDDEDRAVDIEEKSEA